MTTEVLLLNKIPHHKVGGFIYNPSSPQANRYSLISPNGFPSLGVALADDEHF